MGGFLVLLNILFFFKHVKSSKYCIITTNHFSDLTSFFVRDSTITEESTTEVTTTKNITSEGTTLVTMGTMVIIMELKGIIIKDIQRK